MKKCSLRRLRIHINFLIVNELWVYLIVIANTLLCAWIFNRWIEGTMFCIAHLSIRQAFQHQFHFDVTAYCLSLTLAIIWFAIPVTLPVSISLLSSIPIAFVICYLGYIAQDRVEQIKLNKELNEILDKIKDKDIYTMDKDELYVHCRNRGLDDVECKIAYYVIIERLKGKELYTAIGYSESQTKRKRKKILNKLI